LEDFPSETRHLIKNETQVGSAFVERRVGSGLDNNLQSFNSLVDKSKNDHALPNTAKAFQDKVDKVQGLDRNPSNPSFEAILAVANAVQELGELEKKLNELDPPDEGSGQLDKYNSDMMVKGYVNKLDVSNDTKTASSSLSVLGSLKSLAVNKIWQYLNSDAGSANRPFGSNVSVKNLRKAWDLLEKVYGKTDRVKHIEDLVDDLGKAEATYKEFEDVWDHGKLTSRSRPHLDQADPRGADLDRDQLLTNKLRPLVVKRKQAMKEKPPIEEEQVRKTLEPMSFR